MPDCTSIDPLVTPYVDGELSAAERTCVDEHLRRCSAVLLADRGRRGGSRSGARTEARA